MGQVDHFSGHIYQPAALHTANTFQQAASDGVKHNFHLIIPNMLTCTSFFPHTVDGSSLEFHYILGNEVNLYKLYSIKSCTCHLPQPDANVVKLSKIEIIAKSFKRRE